MNKKIIIILIAIMGLICLSPVMASQNSMDINSLTQYSLIFENLFPVTIDVDNVHIEKESLKHTSSDGTVNKSTNYYLKFNLNTEFDHELHAKVISYDKKGKKIAINKGSISGATGEYSIDIAPGKNISKSELLIYDNNDALIFNKTTTKIEKTSNEIVDEPEVQQSTTASSSSSSGATYWASANSDKFHYPGCEWAQKISGKNKIVFHSRDEAISSGYQPCQVCGP